MTGPPEPWNLTDDEAAGFAEAIRTRRDLIPAGWLLRPGGSWSAKPDGIPCTIVAYNPDEEPDGNGRRPSDLDAGQVLLELAAPLCDAYNARAEAAHGRAECAADLRAWILHDPDTINAGTLAGFIHDWDQP